MQTLLGTSFKKIISNVLLFAFLLWTFYGCTTSYRMGNFIRNEEVPGSKELVESEYEFHTIRTPSHNNPQIAISVKRIPKYRIEYNKIYREEEWGYTDDTIDDYTWSWVVLPISGALLSLPLYQVTLPKDERSWSDEWMIGVAIVSFSFFVASTAGIFHGFRKEEFKKISGEVEGESFWELASGTSSDYQESYDLNVSTSGQAKSFKSNNNGIATVNLVKDFGFTDFDNKKTMGIELTSKKLNLKKTIYLNTGDWTTKYIRIVDENAQLLKDSKDNSEVYDFSILGLESKVLSEFGDLYKVECKGKTGYIKAKYAKEFWSVPERLDPKNPPNLVVKHVEFSEPSGDYFLDAEETGNIKIYLKNSGRGDAYRVTLNISSIDNNISKLSFKPFVNIGTIKPEETKEVNIPIKAPFLVENGNTEINIKTTEANGFDAEPINLALQTRAFRPPNLIVSDYGIDDANNNGRIDLGEAVNITARIKNDGQGTAKDVIAYVNMDKSSPNLFYDGYTDKFELEEVLPGESKDISFSILTNTRFEKDKLPIEIKIDESKGKYGSVNPIDLPIDRPMRIISKKVEGILNSATINNLPSLTSDVDINIPNTEIDNKNAVALIIGISKYHNQDIPNVDYAIRDSQTMKEYLINTFGYDEKKIIELYDYDATLASFKRVFEEQLPNYLSPDGSDVFVYYSGHGVPDIDSEEAYLVPYDFNPNYTRSTGYLVNKLYESLDNLDAKSITVVLDACFSGMSDGGQIYRNISPVNIRVKNPAMTLKNGVVFTSTTGNQVSTWYHEQKHGLFTYYFLKGIKGAADLNNNNSITVEELNSYLMKNVSETARLFNREQIPQVFGVPNKIIISY